MFRWSTAGESHGPALLALVEGMPAGVQLTSADFERELARRRLGYGRGARQSFEADAIEVIGGVRHGITLGSPLAVRIGNSEWPKWTAVMSADPVEPEELRQDAGTGDERELARNKPLTKPRPGHADLVGMNKYGFDEVRPVLERASARETAARVVAGTAAKALLEQAAGIRIVSHVVQIGQAGNTEGPTPSPEDAAALDNSPVRCLDRASEAAMMAEIDAAQSEGDTLGGIAEVIAYGVPQGLGTYTVDSQRLDAQLAGAFMSLQAVKGVEIGDGFASAVRRGSQAHDEIVPGPHGIERLTNRAGGIEGGMANGEPIRIRFAVKPISTVPRALRTIDVATGEEATALHQRSDTTAIVPAAVIGESLAALVLAQALCAKFGGDSLAEITRNLANYLDSIPQARR